MHIPVADAERHNHQFSGAQTVTIPIQDLFVPITFKMASEKKVAENMLWGGRFTRMSSFTARIVPVWSS
jgi:hypothetical protein